MKTKIVSLIIIVLACSYACTKDRVWLDDSSTSSVSSLITRSDAALEMTEFSRVVRDKKVTKEFVPTIVSSILAKEKYKSIENYSIQPISKNGRNLMYVVNFEEGGWAIVSGRYDLESLILAYDENDEFNPETIESPECHYWFEMTLESIEQRMIEDEEDNPDELDFDNDYFWVLVPITPQYTTEVVDSVPSFVLTKWGQDFPWNYKCPAFNGTKCPTGCVAVAYAQVLYYLHNKIGKPSSLYHQIDTSYSWNGTFFTPHHSFFNPVSPSPRWNSMPYLNPGIQTQGTNYVGDFMVELGEYQDMEYYVDVSLASLDPSFLSHYNISYSYSLPFNSSYAVAQLDNLLPVLVDGRDSQGNGHAWVLDGYRKKKNTEDRLEQWQRLPIALLDDYNNYICYNDHDMQMLFPNVVENQLVHNYYYSYEYMFSMNWGENGSLDNYYYMYNGIPFTNYQKMVYNFH